jgi:phosphosulfolactate synthase
VAGRTIVGALSVVNGYPTIVNVPPAFLDLCARPEKPRSSGLTHVIDGGLPLTLVEAWVGSHGPLIDFWKLGWGTAYVDPTLPAKVQALRTAGVTTCLGGTLLEIAWAQHRVAECLEWAHTMGIDAVEVSRGVADMPVRDKRDLISRAADHFIVLAETGAKDDSRRMPADEWAQEMVGDRDAGAVWLIAEGRESGTVGIYESTGGIHIDIVDTIVQAVGVESIIFEAPRKEQQAFFINRFGDNVNVGNIAPQDVVSVETMRLGLRADTSAKVLSRSYVP